MANISPEEALKRIRAQEIESLARRQAALHGLPYIDLFSAPVREDALRTLSEEESRRASLVVFAKDKSGFRLAAIDPETPSAQILIHELQKRAPVEIFIASPGGIRKFLDAYRFLPPAREEITGTVHVPETVAAQYRKSGNAASLFAEKLQARGLEIGEKSAWLLAGATILDASDIHIEPEKENVVVRLRLDGILWPFATLQNETYQKLRDRLKLVAGMKLNVRAKPQDGRFSIVLPGEEPIEVRASTVPGAYGENVVLRILNPRIIQLSLENLGLRKDDLAIIEAELRKPNGAIVVTGPTGSGKTTTLYAFLRKVNTEAIKIITIEDPIEYHIPGVEQTQVEETKGYTFAQGLVASLRQDPDVILVGEIRDLETAQTAMHAALTGHLVFSTLHTNDAAGTIPRLIDLGVKPVIIAPAINIAVAQRLLRRLCPRCSQQVVLDEALLKTLSRHLEGLPRRVKDAPRLHVGTKIKKASVAGCANCQGRGYKGRVGIFELFLVGPEMETLIVQSPTEEDVRHLAKKLGMVTMVQDGILKMLEGTTDLEELERTVGAL